MNDLRQRLLNEGWAFEFFQAVHLLERLTGQGPEVGCSGPCAEEVVRLRPNQEMAFPAGDVQGIELLPPNGGGRAVWRVTQNFLGLYGANSPLPSYVPEMIAQAYSDPDPLREFLDIFNNRLAALYYRAWKRNHPAASMDPTDPDRLTTSLCAFIGQEPMSGQDDWVVAPQRLVRYLALLSGQNRTAAGLEALVSDYFGIEGVRVESFHPRRVRLRGYQLTRLGADGLNNRLGQTTVLGQWMRDVGGQFHLSLGPLSQRAFDRLQPGRPAFQELVFLVHFYCRRQLDFSLELILRREDVRPLRLSAREPRNTLGRDSWLGAPARAQASSLLDFSLTAADGGRG